MKYNLSLNQVRDAVISVLGLSPSDFYRRNKQEGVTARIMFTYVCRDLLRFNVSLTKMADYMKLTDHSTVSHYVKIIRQTKEMPESEAKIHNKILQIETYLQESYSNCLVQGDFVSD